MKATTLARAILVPAAVLTTLAATMAVPQSAAQSATKTEVCDIDGLSGRWVNVTRPAGSDIAVTRIRMDCDPSGARSLNPPSVEVGLEVRCMHFVCDWGTSRAAWKKPSKDDASVLTADFTQDRFDRTVAIERPSADRLRVTVTTRFRGLPLSPLQSTYELARASR